MEKEWNDKYNKVELTNEDKWINEIDKMKRHHIENLISSDNIHKLQIERLHDNVDELREVIKINDPMLYKKLVLEKDEFNKKL